MCAQLEQTPIIHPLDPRLIGSAGLAARLLDPLTGATLRLEVRHAYRRLGEALLFSAEQQAE